MTTCKFPGCNRKAKTRGYCAKDYCRLRYNGQIDVRPNSRKGESKAFLLGLLGTKTLECIDFPYGKDQDGYGQVKLAGERRAHRAICRLAHGNPSNPDMHAAHSCGNVACVNPNHLSWKTVTQNMHDKWEHGTMYRGAAHHKAKLTEGQVMLIVADTRGSTTVGREYGVSKHAVQAIRSGESWSALTGIRPKAA